MALTSTPEKVAMLSVTGKSIPVLDLCESYASCSVDEPLLRSAFMGNGNKCDISVTDDFSLLEDSASDLRRTDGNDAASACCSQLCIRSGQHASGCGDAEGENGNSVASSEMNADDGAADCCRCEDVDKTVNVTMETDSGNGGSCCENNADEMLDESIIDDGKDEQELSKGCDVPPDVLSAAVAVADSTCETSDPSAADRSSAVSGGAMAEDGALEDTATDDRTDDGDAVVESAVEENGQAPDEAQTSAIIVTTPSTVTATTASCVQPSTSCDAPTTRIPRLQRQRMGSYGSPPPCAVSRDSASAAAAAGAAGCTDDDAAKQQQYVVNVHVNPGETFSVCISDQVQLIQGRNEMIYFMLEYCLLERCSFLAFIFDWLRLFRIMVCTYFMYSRFLVCVVRAALTSQK
jgi:hypothetical protein